MVWPMVDMVLFGSLGRAVNDNGGSLTGSHAVLLGVFLLHVVYQSSVGLSFGLLEETWSRTLLDMMVSPLRNAEFLTGVAIATISRLVLGTAAAALAAWVGYGFGVFSVGFELVAVYLVLVLTGWTVALFVMGVLLRFGKGAEILTWGILFIVLALSGAFYSPDALPPALRPIGEWIPPGKAFGSARELIKTGQLPWGDLAYAVAGSLALMGLGLVFLRHMLRVFRERGFITRYS